MSFSPEAFRPAAALFSAPRWTTFAGDLLRYFLVSLLALATDFGLLALCVRALGWHYLVAATTGFVAGLVVAYALSLVFVFPRRRKLSMSVEATGFLVTGLAGLAITQAGMALIVDGLGLAPEAAKLPVAGVVFSFNFLSRRLLFASPAPSPGQRA